jgi:hypothetical protein
MHHHDIVGSGLDQVIHRSEHLALYGYDRQPFEVAPVILSRRRGRQLFAPDADFTADQRRGLIAVLARFQPGDNALAVGLPFRQRSLLPALVAFQVPGPVVDDVFTRPGIREDPDPAFYTIDAGNSADDQYLQLFRLPAYCA